MEINLLKGSVDLINRTKPFLYFENEQVEKSNDLIEFVKSLDYRLFWHATPFYNPNNFFKNSINHFNTMGSINMLGVRKDIKIKIDLPEVKDNSFHP